MTWPTLRAAQTATAIEFTPTMAQRHHFVRCPNGRWARTLGAPSGRDPILGTPRPLRRVRGRVWYMADSGEQA